MNTIDDISRTPTGLVVNIEGFGPWGLPHDCIAVLRDGSHTIYGSWPVGEAWCDQEWMNAADERLAQWVDDEQDAARFEAMQEATLTYPGSPMQVYNGWVWYRTGGHEHFRSPTYRELIESVYESVERLGVEEAFDLEVQS